jgi:carbonic anhydrase
MILSHTDAMPCAGWSSRTRTVGSGSGRAYPDLLDSGMRFHVVLPCLLALVATTGCIATSPRPGSPPMDAPVAATQDDQVRRLEQRLSELEKRVNAAPAPAGADGHGPGAIEPRQQPQAALQLLISGNSAFAAGRPRPVDLSQTRVGELTKGQKPYAVIIGCADSRTPPEHLFGAGLGDLFTVRVAGNVVDEAAVASVEYAVAHLGCRLVVVLGHTSCGAVSAAVADAKDTPAIIGLVSHIAPAVAEARRSGENGLVNRAVLANAMRQRDALHASQLLAGMERRGELALTVATYDLSDGAVDWLDFDGLAAPGQSAPRAAGAPREMPAPAPAHH